MGQEEIAKILMDNYPEYLSYKDILKHTNVSWRTVQRNLSSLIKRNEVEFIMLEVKFWTDEGKYLNSKFEKRYRIRRDIYG
jgi:DeoR/GlpR family transcriptional regulator of sugar metabolism